MPRTPDLERALNSGTCQGSYSIGGLDSWCDEFLVKFKENLRLQGEMGAPAPGGELQPQTDGQLRAFAPMLIIHAEACGLASFMWQHYNPQKFWSICNAINAQMSTRL